MRTAIGAGAEVEIDNVMTLVDKYVAVHEVPAIKGALDDKYYAVGLTLVTIVLLVVGRYGFIQIFSTVLVGLFTLVTIANVFGLQVMDSGVCQY